MAPVVRRAGGIGRELQVQGNDGCVWFEVTVPDQLQNIVVLDASLVVRLLPTLNDQIKIDPHFPTDLIDYSHVTLNRLDHPVGRGGMNDIFDNHWRLDKFAKELAHVINNKLPEDEGVNIWTFKPKGQRDYPKFLSSALARQGVDMAAELRVDGQDRPRVALEGAHELTRIALPQPKSLVQTS